MASRPAFIGVVIACAGNILISLALNCQKLAHERLGNGVVSQEDEQQDGHSQSARHVDHTTHLSSPGVVEETPQKPLNGNPWAMERECDGYGVYNGELIDLTVHPAFTPAKSTVQPPTPDAASGSTAAPGFGRSFSDGQGPNQIQPYTTVAFLPPNKSTDITLSNRKQDMKPKSSNDEEAEDGNEDEGSDGTAGDDNNEKRPQGVSYLKSKLWWAGIILMALGETGNFLSYGFAPASVVAPLGTVALIANCFFAPLMLKERFYWRDLVGVTLAVLGAVTVVLSASSANPQLSPKGLLKAVRQPAFIAYLAVTLLAVMILLGVTHSRRFGNRWIGIDIGICALFGGYTVLATKALSSLISTLLFKSFGYLITWILLVVVAVTSVLQIKYLNRALQVFASKEVIPTQFVFFTISAIVGSAVLYQEFRDITISRMANFLFGIATTFLGVFLLTAKFATQSESSQDGGEEDVGVDGNGGSEGEEDDSLQDPRNSNNRRVPHRASPLGRLMPLPENSALMPIIARRNSRGYQTINSNSPMGATTTTGTSAPPTRPGGTIRKRASTVSLSAPRATLASGGLLLLASSPTTNALSPTLLPFTHGAGGSSGGGGLSGSRSRDRSKSLSRTKSGGGDGGGTSNHTPRHSLDGDV